MHEDSNISVNFNLTETDLGKAQAALAGKMKEAQDFAPQAGITEIYIQSSNYSISSNSSGGCGGNANKTYQVYGNMTFKITPESKAADFATLLDQNGYNVNLNGNSYRQCDGGGEDRD